MRYANRTPVSAALFLSMFLLLSASPNAEAQTHEIVQETIDAWTWFGGDDRPAFDRSVGNGQSVRMNESMRIDSFAFHFNAIFDYSQNPDGHGHEVTLRLHMHDSSGTVVKSSEVTLPDSFTDGWVTWHGLDLSVSEGDLVIFTTFLVGGYDVNQYTSSFSMSSTDTYPEGMLFGKYAKSDNGFAEWEDWSGSSSRDAAFRLMGTLTTTEVGASRPAETAGIHLSQNYPNPVRDVTRFAFSLPRPAHVTLSIFNLLGERVALVKDTRFSSGLHQIDWTNRNLPSGIYRIELRTANTISTRMMNVVR